MLWLCRRRPHRSSAATRLKPVAALKRNQNEPILSTLTIEQVIEHLAKTIEALPEQPIVIGHSFGGLLTQLMVQRGLASAARAVRDEEPSVRRAYA